MEFKLGRKPSPPDERDWSSNKIHDFIKTRKSSELDTDQTVGDAAKSMTSWYDVLHFASLLWAWIKANIINRPPSPTPSPEPPQYHLWSDYVVLDQGNYGTCVGNAGAGWLASEPEIDQNVDEALARKLYYETTCIDGACDSTYQDGATVRSLAKALKNRGRLSAYAFAQNMDEIDEWLDNHGSIAGGHAYLLRYREPNTTLYHCRNSWGESWGKNGDFFIEKEDLNKLIFLMNGEALLSAELPL